MLPFYGKTNRVTGQLRDRLKTTSMGLGLVRLQMDVGLVEEARKTLASLQDDFQLLLHSVENPMETAPTKSNAGMNAKRNPDKSDFLDLTEGLLAVHS